MVVSDGLIVTCRQLWQPRNTSCTRLLAIYEIVNCLMFSTSKLWISVPYSDQAHITHTQLLTRSFFCLVTQLKITLKILICWRKLHLCLQSTSWFHDKEQFKNKTLKMRTTMNVLFKRNWSCLFVYWYGNIF